MIKPIEHFKTLREIQSLDIKQKNCLDQIDSEHKRVLDLNKKENLKSEERKELALLFEQKKAELQKRENNLSQIEKSLERSENNLNSIKNQNELNAVENELVDLKRKKNEEEEDVFSLMEQIENIQQNLHELEEFLTGIKKSEIEIKKEVDNKVEKVQLEINNFKLRIENLESTLPSNFLQAYQQARKRYPHSFPLTTITEKLTCERCFMLMERSLFQKVNQVVALENCPSCSRIILPLSSF